MPTFDPIPPDLTAQQFRKEAWWPAMKAQLPPFGKRSSLKSLNAGIIATIAQGDWGTAEQPGVSLWALRGAVSEATNDRSPDAPLFVAALGAHLASLAEPLPVVAHDLWSRAVFRSMGLKTLMSEAGEGRGTDEAQVTTAARRVLFEQLLRHVPDLMRWLVQDPTVLVGTSPDGVPYGNQAWKSPLAFAFGRPNPRHASPWPGLGELILATHPLTGIPEAVRQATYGTYAVDHPVLMAAILNEGQTKHDLTMTRKLGHGDKQQMVAVSLASKLLAQHDLDRFKTLAADGAMDLTQRDAWGQTLLHTCVEALRTTVTQEERIGPGRYVPRTVYRPDTELAQELAWLEEALTFVAGLGVDLYAPSTPSTLPRMSKTTGRPVRGTWPYRGALPGETVDTMLNRQLKQGLLPAAWEDQLQALWRNLILTHTSPPPSTEQGRRRFRA